MSWMLIIGAVICAFAASCLYLAFDFARFGFMKKLLPKKVARVIAALVVIAAAAGCVYLKWGYMNAAVVLIHITLFRLLAGLVVRLIGRKSLKGNLPGAVSLALSAIYLAWGFYSCVHVDITRYEIKSDKLDGSLRIVQFADSHLGTVFGAEGFAKQLERMNELNPDIVVITGDLVDDNTSLTELTECCRELADLKTRYGVYYVFGNHDKGYSSRSSRGWGYDELVAALRQNGVNVLEDETVIIDGRFAVVGRQDYSARGRADAASLVPQNLYSVVLDHQPHDYVNEQAAGSDLVLSGHTHGGQMIPINRVGYWIGENDMTYGHEKRGNTDFIVTSGIADWELMFKTGCKSEFVVIDINR